MHALSAFQKSFIAYAYVGLCTAMYRVMKGYVRLCMAM